MKAFAQTLLARILLRKALICVPELPYDRSLITRESAPNGRALVGGNLCLWGASDPTDSLAFDPGSFRETERCDPPHPPPVRAAKRAAQHGQHGPAGAVAQPGRADSHEQGPRPQVHSLPSPTKLWRSLWMRHSSEHDRGACEQAGGIARLLSVCSKAAAEQPACLRLCTACSTTR